MGNPEVEDPQPIPGADGETVQFRRWATYADEIELMTGGAELVERNAPRAEQLAYLPTRRTCLMIAAWSFRNGSGEPLEVTPENLQTRVPRRAVAWLIAEAERRYDGRPEEREGPFGGGSQRSSSTDTP